MACRGNSDRWSSNCIGGNARPDCERTEADCQEFRTLAIEYQVWISQMGQESGSEPILWTKQAYLTTGRRKLAIAQKSHWNRDSDFLSEIRADTGT